MNRLLLAQEGYRRLSAAMTARLDEDTSDRAEEWLTDEVCPVVEELVLSQRFRSSARWSVDHLNLGAQTPERQLVQDVDDALVHCARELVSATVEDGVESPPDEDHASAVVAIHAEDRATLEMIAGRPWFDLVCVEEYFHANLSLLLESGLVPQDLRHKHLKAFRQKELRIPLGDYVARSMFARIDYWKSIVDKLWRGVFSKLPPGRGECIEPHNRLFVTKTRLDQAVTALDKHCCSGTAALQRNACAALTQVYAAYVQEPNLEWLGCPQRLGKANAGLIRSCVRRRSELRIAEPNAQGRLRVVETKQARLCDPDVLRHIAAALHDVIPIYEIPDEPDALIEWANDRARLVLVDRFPRALYWDGMAVAEERWDDSPNEWNLMWTLARNAQRLVTQRFLSTPDRHPIKSRRSRLKRLLSEIPDLDDLIEVRRGTGGYWFELPPGDIYLLQNDGHGQLQIVRRNQPST